MCVGYVLWLVVIIVLERLRSSNNQHQSVPGIGTDEPQFPPPGDTGFCSRPHLHFAVYQTIDGEARRTIPVEFETQPGKVEPLKPGRSY